MMRYLLLAVIALLSVAPTPFAHAATPPPTITIAAPPPHALATALSSIDGDGPLHFADGVAVGASLDAWAMNTTPDGFVEYRLRIAAPGAAALHLVFDRAVIPANATLTLDNGTATPVVLMPADIAPDATLTTPLVHNSQIDLTLTTPPESTAELRLSDVGYAFFDPFDPPAPQAVSGSCNVDVVCPLGQPWARQARGVMMIQFREGNRTLMCSGALLNTTIGTLQPLVLTADHCGITATSAPSIVTYWNYRSTTCRPPGGAASGGNGDGVLQTLGGGAVLRARHTATDTTLLELTRTPPASFRPVWNGWNRSETVAGAVFSLHHPRGAEQRISTAASAQISSYAFTTSPGDGTHLRIDRWLQGTTEPGSSGGPLFDSNGRVIGQLHGGAAACGNTDSDWYGRLARAWTGGGTPQTRLSDWLDPLGLRSSQVSAAERPTFNWILPVVRR